MKNTTQLTLLKDLGMEYPSLSSKRKRRYGLYRCMCDKEFKASIQDVNSGSTNSCGCYNRVQSSISNSTHGLTKHPLYKIHSSMIHRVTNPKDKHFADYGGRGITISKRWVDVANFIEDMYPSYQLGLSIDRIDNDGNYEFSNCRWATPNVQARNTRVLKANNTSGYRGVSWDKQSLSWRARIMVDSKTIALGHFKDSYEGAVAYDTYIVKNGLEHSRNFPDKFTNGSEL